MPALTPKAWAEIRTAYEHTERPVADICAGHGISSGTLRDRMRRWGWTRRRPPIPREGPPAVIVPEREEAPSLPLPACGERSASEASRVRGRTGDSEPVEMPPHPDPFPASGERENTDTSAAPSDPAAVAARLQGAVGRVLPAIEATIATIAAGPQRPREMEQSARALGVLMRTLRELNALVGQHAPAAADDDPIPADIDEFRFELARRINALVAAEKDRAAEEARRAEETAADP